MVNDALGLSEETVAPRDSGRGKWTESACALQVANRSQCAVRRETLMPGLTEEVPSYNAIYSPETK
ncbi:hypothetical protein J6590_073104 [Homalodisca vitripennis]|nr:hypothetical protein J6590_073104 [Homalodisca vitripennis]